MKRILGILLLVIFSILLILMWFKRDNFKHINRDWKIGVVTQNGWEIVNISPGRRMVNSIIIDENVELWVGGDGGWMDQNRVKKILSETDDKKFIERVFFYNFGFIPDKIEYLNEVGEWNNNGKLLKIMGVLSWLNFSYMRDRMIFNDDLIDKDLLSLNSYFNDVMMRDFSDTDLINEEDIKLTVINASQENGLAAFISSRLEWVGMSVISSGNENREIKDSCLMVLGPGTENTVTHVTLKSLFECGKELDMNLSDGEIELYFGENFSKVLKYSSYVRTF